MTEYFEMDCACKGSNLDKMLQPAILMELYKKDLHGFILIQKLAHNPMFNGTQPDKTGVYRYLKKMEASGLLSSYWEMADIGTKPKRVYAITQQGKTCLVNWLVALKQYVRSVDSLVNDIDDTIKNKNR